MTKSGSFVGNGSDCVGTDGDKDIVGGAQVIVRNQADVIVGVGTLAQGDLNNGTCQFTFSVRDVPSDATFYGVDVAGRGAIEFTAKDARSGPLALHLGN